MAWLRGVLARDWTPGWRAVARFRSGRRPRSTVAGMAASDLRLERAWQGVRAWSGFPADAKPRPFVLLFPAVTSAGFPDADKKMAFLSGTVEADPEFPEPLL